MRLRLLHRRLTISAPRMAVRSSLPWPLRWALAAIVLGFCAAIGLWAFEFGREIAGLDHGSKQELRRLQSEIESLQAELGKANEARDKAQSIANTAETLANIGKASDEKLLSQVKQLQAQNQSLRDDLGLFEKLLPSAGLDSIAIRSLQVEMESPQALKWQALVVQSSKNAKVFDGKLELAFNGLHNGKPWTASLPGGPQTLSFRQYGRVQGVLEVPAQVVVKSVVAKVLEGNTVRVTQSLKL
ncbi:MAG: hypothetical protein ORN29_10305 [Rhodoferax sp.]|nr:hypothetical protein [Rhodoferax sp.]